MQDSHKRWTRREFLRSAGSLALLGPAGASIFCSEQPPGGAGVALGESLEKRVSARHSARVVLVRDKDVLDGGRRPRPDVIARMLDAGVGELLGESRPEAAWARLVQPEDVVGIKSNEWRFLPTPRELEHAIRQRVLSAGVASDRIGIDDRGALRNPVFHKATALINVRPMRTHHWAGVGGCIKNHIMFSPDPSSWHPDACASLAGLWDLPLVKGKTRLNVLAMLTPLFHGKGPHHFLARYTWEYGGLIVGTDPVAVDATGLRILEAKRREYFGNDQPFTVSPKHIRMAEDKYRLGVADPARIEVLKLGWTERMLI
ncbi:MAG: DUF362 domain-containing protein [Acidobacteriota bacterium]